MSANLVYDDIETDSQEQRIMVFAELVRAELTRMQEEIDALKEKQKQHKEASRARLAILLADTGDRTKETVISELYWNYDDVFDAETLSRPLGLAGNALGRYVRNHVMKVECYDCGQIVDYRPTSRSDAQYHKKNKCVCGECQAKREQNWAKEAELRQRRLDYIQVLKRMPYREYLTTEHWQNMRREMLRRAKYRCQLCNTTGELHVHHRTYENRGDEKYGDLIVLCADCHQTFHDNGKVQS